MAEKTRRAYGVDLGQFARWCTAQDVAPGDVGSEGPCAATSPVLSGRTPSRHHRAQAGRAARLLSHAARARPGVQNPVDLISSPRRPRSCRACCAPTSSPAARRIPASTPLELRDRAMFEVAYACGLRAEELVILRSPTSTSTPSSCAWRARAPRRGSCPWASRPWGPWRATSSARGPPSRRATASRRGPTIDRQSPPPGASSSPKTGRRLGDERRAPAPATVDQRAGTGRRGLAARAAPQLRDPPARRRRGPARDPGDARPRQRVQHPDLHSGRVRPA